MSQAELRNLFEALGAEASTAFRLVPIDPCRALSAGNARMAVMQEDDVAAAAPAAAASEVDGVVEGPGQPGGLVQPDGGLFQ